MRDPRILRALVAVVLLRARTAPADSAWTVPGVVHANGLNGTHFVSDLVLTNPGAAAAHVTPSFFPAGPSAAGPLTLAPGQTVVLSDAAASLFGVTGGAGAVSLVSDQPLLVRAKTYNTSTSGTYGVSLPVVASDRLLGPGDRAESLWITQDASGAAGYRTNVAVVFPDDSGGAATVTVFDADGNEKGRQDYGLDASGLQQFPVGSFAGTVAAGRAEIAVTRGHAAGYAVVVDNVTGDSSLFAFEDLAGGRQDVVVNGVARASGRNGAFFRTDGRFYNPTDTDATVTVSFHASGNSNTTPQTAPFVVPAGKIRDVVDVLDSLLSLPVGSAGALRFQSNWPVAILCRTSNVDPSGARPGTFGSQQKPVQLLSFVTSADAGAAVTGIRQDAAFRTNVGFAAGPDGASYALTLKDESGTTVATTTASLGVFGWTQPSIQDLFPTITIPENATLLLKVTSGSVDVFDSSIDNLSGDPVVTPIAALPASIPSSATIGPAGGSIRSDDGRLTLRVPAGALSTATAVSFQTTTNDAPQGTGPGYLLSPSGLAFAQPALLTLAYTSADTESSSAEALAIVSRTTSTWRVFGDGAVDSARRLLTVPISSPSPSIVGTAPARAASADGGATMAVTKAWVLSPQGKLAVPTGGRIGLSVSTVGPPSSRSLVDFVSGTLATVPESVDAVWFLNDHDEYHLVSGDGSILHEGGGGNLSVLYQAPSCPPPGNPVLIQAAVRNKTGGFFKPWYAATGSSRIRVLPRDWTFKSTLHQVFACPAAFAADDVTYTSGFTFSLDDNLAVTNIGTVPDATEFFGDPRACDPTDVDLSRIDVPHTGSTLVGGGWDKSLDAFRLTIDWVMPTALGYSYAMLAPDGTKYFTRFDTGPLVPVPGIEQVVNEGNAVHSFPLPTTVYFKWNWDLEHVKGSCP